MRGVPHLVWMGTTTLYRRRYRTGLDPACPDSELHVDTMQGSMYIQSHTITLRCIYVHTYMLMLSLSLPVYQVRLDWLPLPCTALIHPSQLSCLGSSVGRSSAS